jgi:hypothetical protein
VLSVETFSNDLAVDFYPAIIIAVADVLQQMRHFWKRAPFAIFGQMFLSLPNRRLGIRFHGVTLGDTNPGYKEEKRVKCAFVSA